jgi:Holliday junction resolvase
MSSATKGRAYEHEVRDMLRAHGYAVTRGAGSKGQFDSPEGVVNCDLIASRITRSNGYELQLLIVQAKVRGLRRSSKKTKNSAVASPL